MGGSLVAGLTLLAQDRGLLLAKQILIPPMRDNWTAVNHIGELAIWSAKDNVTEWMAYLRAAIILSQCLHTLLLQEWTRYKGCCCYGLSPA